jgi:hypothetical protein
MASATALNAGPPAAATGVADTAASSTVMAPAVAAIVLLVLIDLRFSRTSMIAPASPGAAFGGERV